MTTIVVALPWIDGQRGALIVLSTTSPKPVLSWVVRVVTGEPHSEVATIAGAGTTIVSRDGKRPAVVLIPGVVDRGRANPDVQRLARGLARAGCRVFVPDLPGLGDGEIVPATVKGAVDVATEVLRRDDRARRPGRLRRRVGRRDHRPARGRGPLSRPSRQRGRGRRAVDGGAERASPRHHRHSLENGKPVTYGTSPALALMTGCTPPFRAISTRSSSSSRRSSEEAGSGAGSNSRPRRTTSSRRRASRARSSARRRRFRVTELDSVAHGLPKTSIGNLFATQSWLVGALRAAK